MAIGALNPTDNDRSTNARPAEVNGGVNERRWFTDTVHTRPRAQDFNRIIAQFRSVIDYYGVADTEGIDTYLLSAFQAITDNAEWTVSGASGTADISAKKGTKGRLTAAIGAGITSLGAVQTGRRFEIVSAVAGGARILPGATILTPNNLPIFFQSGDTILVVGDSTGTQYRVSMLSELTSYNTTETIATNGDMEIWQENTTFTLAANTTTFLSDHWKGRRAATGMTVSRQAGFSGSRYCMRVQRTAADVSTSPLIVGYQIPSVIAQALAGKSVIVSFDLRCGADAVTALGAGATLAPGWSNGAGYDESPNLVNGAFTTPNGAAQSASFSAHTPSTVAARNFSSPIVVTAATTESFWRLIYTPIATAAGAAEYIEFTNFKIDIGNKSTPFVAEPTALALVRAKRRYQKTCPQSVVPTTNLGLGNGEKRFPATTAGAAAGFVGHVDWEVEMAGTPVVTLLNPAAANAQVRNITDSADLTASAAGNITSTGCDITATGTAGTAVGETLGIGLIADIRL